MLEIYHTKQIPSLALLSKYDSDVFCEVGGYSFSYTLIDFIIQKWGFKKVLALINNYDLFEDIFGITMEEFELEWREYIKRYYLSKPFNFDVEKLTIID